YFETLFPLFFGRHRKSVGADGNNRLVLLGRSEWHRCSVEVQGDGTFVVPRVDDAVAPEGSASVVLYVPALYRIIGVPGVVVAGVDLDPVSVRVAQIQVERVGNTMPAGSTFDVVLFAERSEDITGVQDLVTFLRGERD